MSNRGKYVQTLPAAVTTQEEMPADGMCRQLELQGAWGSWKEPGEVGVGWGGNGP